jgi:hypothetical protein
VPFPGTGPTREEGNQQAGLDPGFRRDDERVQTVTVAVADPVAVAVGEAVSVAVAVAAAV